MGAFPAAANRHLIAQLARSGGIQHRIASSAIVTWSSVKSIRCTSARRGGDENVGVRCHIRIQPHEQGLALLLRHKSRV